MPIYHVIKMIEIMQKILNCAKYSCYVIVNPNSTYVIVCTYEENSISSIFDKCLILLQTIWPSNHTSHTKVYFNEFVANALRDNIGWKKSASILRKIIEAVFSFKYQKFGVRVNYTITNNQRNQIQLHKVNDFDFCFVSKFMFYILDLF